MAETPKVSIKDADIITLLRPDLDAAKLAQDQWAIKRETYYKLFRGAPYGNERDGWSKSIAPLVWTQHQSTLSALVEIFSDEFFTLKSDDSERANKNQKYIRYQMFRKQDGYKKITDFLFNAGLYPIAVFKVFHKDDYELSDEQYKILNEQQFQMLSQDPKRQVTKYDQVQTDGEINPQLEAQGLPQAPPTMSYENVKVIRKDIKYSGPAFETVQPWAFGYSSDCKITEWGGIDGRLIYHGPFKLTLNDIRKREKAGIYRKGTFDKCKDLGSATLPKGVDELAIEVTMDGVSEVYNNGSRSEVSSSPEDLTRELNVKECYVKLDIDKDGLLEHTIVTIIEDDVIAQVEENPYGRAPFRVGSMLPEPHKVHGIAPPSILEHEQKIETNLLRFIQDAAAQSCYRNPVTNDTRMQQSLQERKPFDVILGDPARLGEVKTSPPDRFILDAWELLKSSNEETTGGMRLNQGADSSSLNNTATGAALASQGSAKRLRMSAKALGNGPITGLIKDFIFINKTWPPQEPVNLFGQNITIDPQDVQGDYDVEIDIGVSPAEKQAIAQQLDLLIQFGTQAGLQMGIMKPVHILKAQKKKYSQLNLAVDDLMMSEPEFNQQEQQKQQQAQQNPPPPDPAQHQMQIQAQQAQDQAQHAQAQTQIKMQESQQQMQLDQQEFQLKAAEAQQRMQIAQATLAASIEKNRVEIEKIRSSAILDIAKAEAAEQGQQLEQYKAFADRLETDQAPTGTVKKKKDPLKVRK